MRKAIIDLGTNTFNLLIAEIKNGKLKTLHTDKLPVLLGMGGINEGYITEGAMQRAKDALIRFKEIAKDYDVKYISGIGTSALRGAANAAELVIWAKEELNIPIEVVSGQVEADLIYQGVKYAYPFENSSVIMDIGGGSTEFIHADSTGMQQMTSLDIGVSRIFQTLGQPDHFDKKHIEMVNAFLEKEACDFFDTVDAKILVGATGSFETLYSLISKTEFPPQNQALEIPMDKAVPILNWIISSSLEERLENDFIVPMRKKMLPIAALKVKWVIDKLDIDQIFVSPCSLKEGALTRDK